MAAGDRGGYASSVDQVMSQVLVAERDARDAVARCRSEAVQILAAAEESVRCIAERAEGRVKLIHRIADQAAERALQEIHGTESGLVSAPPDADVRDLLDRAVEELVDEILSAKP